MAARQKIDDVPGFRRRFRITPGAGRVCCQVEDDYHCMSVVVRHRGGVASAVQAHIHRAPWSTCPGAERQLQDAFTGAPLAEFARRTDKRSHCTHLFDLALLAADHAGDDAPTVIDILVTDEVDGERRAELRRDGVSTLAWREAGLQLLEPEEAAGTSLFELQPWIRSLPGRRQEDARLLRWGNLLANGRAIPLAEQSDATQMAPSCYSFQPERAVQARRIGEIRDFSAGGAAPLVDLEVLD